MDLMDPKTDIKFLKKPEINLNKLEYILNKKKVYANLFEINLNKDLKMYQYPFAVTPEIPAGDIRIRQKLFKACNRQLKTIYGECFISGDSLYGIKKVEEIQNVKCILYLNGRKEYILDLQKVSNEKKN